MDSPALFDRAGLLSHYHDLATELLDRLNLSDAAATDAHEVHVALVAALAEAREDGRADNAERHRALVSRLLKRADDSAVSGAALASRIASDDPDAQRILVESVKAIRDPRAFLDRLGRALDAPLSCGHPLDCLPDHEPQDAATVRCGWCEAVEERDALAARIAGYEAELAAVDQALGRALGYPTEGPEIGGDHSTVCTGEHTPASLADEARNRIVALEAAVRAADAAGDKP